MATAIQTHALSRSFGSVHAVRSLDLQVPEQSVYGFLGLNGAGKTTTIRLLLGLARPSAGSVTASRVGQDRGTLPLCWGSMGSPRR